MLSPQRSSEHTHVHSFSRKSNARLLSARIKLSAYGYGLAGSVRMKSLRLHHVKCPDHVKPPTDPPDDAWNCSECCEMEPMIGQITAVGSSPIRPRIGSNLNHNTSCSKQVQATRPISSQSTNNKCATLLRIENMRKLKSHGTKTPALTSPL